MVVEELYAVDFLVLIPFECLLHKGGYASKGVVLFYLFEVCFRSDSYYRLYVTEIVGVYVSVY